MTRAEWLALGRLVGISVLAVGLAWFFRDELLSALSLLERAADSPWALPIAFGFFLLGSLALVPQSILIATAVAAFGLVEGGLMAWVSITAVVMLHVLTARTFRGWSGARVSSERIATLRDKLVRNSFKSALLIRIVPSGPFLLVNVAAGLAGVRLAPFLAGTVVGTIPKIVLIGLVTQGTISTARGQQIGLGLALVALGLLGGWWLARRARRVGRLKSEK